MCTQSYIARYPTPHCVHCLIRIAHARKNLSSVSTTLISYKPRQIERFANNINPDHGAPSKARRCQPGSAPGPGSLGQAPGTACCVAIGNAGGEAQDFEEATAPRPGGEQSLAPSRTPRAALPDLRQALARKRRSHFTYCGVTDNSKRGAASHRVPAYRGEASAWRLNARPHARRVRW